MRKDLCILTFGFLFYSLLLFGYYLFFDAGRMTTVYKNWDGPSYVIAAESLYVPSVAAKLNTINSPAIRSDWTFLPAHFPLVPLLVRAFSFVGYYRALLMLSLAASLSSILAFYYLVAKHKLTSHPLLLTFPFILLTPRWFVVSHVGGSEPLFMLLLILFFEALLSRRHLPAALFAALAVLTRPQGALLGIATLALALIDLGKGQSLWRTAKTFWPYLSIPLALLGVFLFYHFQTGDFWAFFSALSIFHHSSIVPFSTFSYLSENVETFWQEINAVDYVAYATAVIMLLRSRLRPLGIVGLVFFAPLPFLHHSDISRYALPLLPLALISYRELVATREFNLGLLLMSPAILRYAINFMDFNHGV